MLTTIYVLAGHISTWIRYSTFQSGLKLVLEENCVQQKETIKRKSQNNYQGQANCCPPQSQDIKVSSNPFLLIQKIKDSDKIPLVPRGSLLTGLRTLDPLLGPPSTLAEFFRHMCL